MTNLPIVSIIIPTYNSAPYIISCLKSVVDQTYKRGIECIIVDDCGNDNSIQIAESFISGYEGIVDFKIIHRHSNGGLSAARNTGIKAAKGEYLYFLDSDDEMTPECLELMLTQLNKHPNAECVFAGAIPTSGYEWMRMKNKNLPEYSNNPEWIIATMSCRYLLNMTAWNRLVNRSFLLQNNLFFEEGYIHEDELWSLEMSIRLREIAICPHDTYIYQVRGKGIISKEDDNKMFDNKMKIWSLMLDRLPHNAPPALLGCLFLTQNHWDLSLEKKNMHTKYLKKIANHSHSIACATMNLYLLLPEFLQKKSIVKRALFRFFEPYSIYSRLSPIV